MKKILLIPVLFLTACSGMKDVRSPQFEQSEIQSGIFLTCNAHKSWDSCYADAIKACPSGYDVISRDENYVMQARTLRIECKK